MKKININLIAASFLSLLSLSSCLKDDDHYVDFSAQPVIVELPKAGYSVKVLENQEAAQDVNITVNIASPNTLDHDVVATLAIDAAAITKYNAANSGTFELIPANAIQIANSKVTIPAGQRQATFTVKVLAKQLDETKKFMLPVKITDASGLTVSGNFNTALVSFALKNKYDAVYKVTGSALREGDSDLSGAFPEQTYTLSTAGTNVVIMDRVACWKTGANIGGIGPFKLTVDANNNVTVTDAVNPAVKNNGAGVNKYDPVTKTFKISVYWGTGPTNRAWEATFVYSKPSA